MEVMNLDKSKKNMNLGKARVPGDEIELKNIS